MLKRTLLRCISTVAMTAACLIPMAPATGFAADEADDGDQFGANILTHGDLALVTPTVHEREDHNVFLYRRASGAWHREAQFVQRSQMSSAGGLKAGALANDTLALGFPFVSSPSTRFAGVVEVHRREGSNWTLSATLQPTAPSDGMRFGTAVAIDGDWLVIGAPGEPTTSNSEDPGRVFVYRWQSGAYVLVQTLSPADGAPRDRFGMRLDFTGGQLLVTSARHVAQPPSGTGAVYVYTLQDQNWSMAQKIATASGTGVAVDGDVLVTHRRVADTTELVSFIRQQGLWQPAATGPRLPYNAAIQSLALLEGQPTRLAAVFVPEWSIPAPIYVWEFRGGVWEAPVLAGSGGNIGAGWFQPKVLALTSDQVLAGDESFNSGSLIGRGVVRAYPLVAEGNTEPETLEHGGEHFGDRFGNSVAFDGDWMIAGAEGRDQPSDSRIQRDAGQAIILKRGPQGWAQHQSLDASGTPSARALYGMEVGMRGDLAVVRSAARSLAAGILGRIEVYRRGGEQWSRLCEAIPEGTNVTGLAPYSGLRTDGEHIIANTSTRLFAWRATAAGCEWQGEIVEPDFGFPVSVPISNIVDGRFLAKLPAQQVNGQAVGAWAVFEFDGQAWSRTETLVGTCPGDAPVMQSASRIAFPCYVDTGQLGSTEIAQIYERQNGAWARAARVTVTERDRWVVGPLAWDGDDLLVVLRGRPTREVRIFAAPDYVSTGSLAAEAEDCFGTTATQLIAGGGEVVLGCPDHNGIQERRSGRLQVFERLPTAPGSVAYAVGASIELPRSTAIHIDGFEQE